MGQTTFNDRHLDWNVLAWIDFDQAFAVQTIFTNALIVDSRKITNSVFMIFKDVGEPLDFKIFATAFVNENVATRDTIPPDSHDSWVNVLDLEDDPADYDHGKFKTIPAAKQRFYESWSNRWSWVRLQVKSANPQNIKVYHRGSN